MTQEALNYAADLRKTDIPREMLTQVKEILEVVPQVRVDFENPAVAIEKKHLVIERVFPKEIRNFIKILCDNNDFSLFDEIVTAYDNYEKEPTNQEMKAELVYVTAPDEEQLSGIRKFLYKEFGSEDMEIEMKQDKSLKSGFILRVGTKEYDWSEQGRIEQLKTKIAGAVSHTGASVSEENIISILRSSIEDFALEAKNKEIGVVNWVGDGIVNVDGIDHAC